METLTVPETLPITVLETAVRLIRESSTLGRGTCSTIDECDGDPELMAKLNRLFHAEKTGLTVWASLIEMERAFWYREGVVN